MKNSIQRLSILFILIIFSGCSTWIPHNLAKKELSSSTNQLSVTYDRFDDITTFESRESRVHPTPEMMVEWNKYASGNNPLDYFPHQIYVRFLGFCEGNSKCLPEQIVIMFESISTDGWKLLDYNKLILLFGDERFEFSEPDIENEVLGGSSVMSIVTVYLPYDEFKEMASNDIVEGKLGIYEIELGESTQSSMRELINEIEKNKN